MTDGEPIESIKRRSRNSECGSCGNTSWMVQDGEFALVEVSGGDFSPSGIPLTAVVCSQCGLIRLYSNLVGD